MIRENFRKSIDKKPFRERVKKNNLNFGVTEKDEQLFKDAVYQGYLDACRRFDFVNKDEYIVKRDTALNDVAKKIREFFDEDLQKDWNAASFDLKHTEWCEILNNSFKEEVKNMSYGLAQKIINMAFKYLYCCNGADSYEDHFKYCHMTLDSFTLSWYQRVCGGQKKYKWSSIAYDEYEKIQKEIRDKMDELHTGVNLIDAEFIIWSGEIYKNAKITLEKASKDYEKARNIYMGYKPTEEDMGINKLFETYVGEGNR